MKHITDPFPNGESYEDCLKRMKDFLDHLRQKYNGRDINVLMIGHRATQYSLEHWIKGISLEDAILASWEWQPGWVYAY